MWASPPHAHRIATDVATAEAIVRQEMRSHAYVLEDDPATFFDHFLSGKASRSKRTVADITASVKAALLKNGTLKPAGTGDATQWTKFPVKQPQNEASLYKPMIEILQAITKECSSIAEDDITIKTTWIDQHERCIKSHRNEVDWKPDVFSVRQGSPRKRGDNGVTPKEIWWRMVQTILEIKKRGDTSLALVQLLRYIRQALCEQPDRRFMYGLVLAGKFLQVWHVDRSGAIAPKQFDIHKRPDLLIQTVVALLVKPPKDMGWDPTMLMYPPVGPGTATHVKPCPSYEIPVPQGHSNEAAVEAFYHQRWLVSVSSEDSPRAKPTEFVLFRVISWTDSEVIRGRATRVWHAWLKADYDNIKDMYDRPTYVFKDCWRDERRGLEGHFYKKAQAGTEDGRIPGVASMLLYGAVKIGKEVDSTNFVRGEFELPDELLPIYLRERTTNYHENTQPDTRVIPTTIREEQAARQWAAQWLDGETLSKSPPIPQYNRVHSRLVMRDYGIPIYRFTSLTELLGAFRDAIAGHRALHDKGVLHRDISIGNILITPHRKVGCRGMLIDLDYARETPVSDDKTLHDDERSGTKIFMGIETVLRRGVANGEFHSGFRNDPDPHDPAQAPKNIVAMPAPLDDALDDYEQPTSMPKPKVATDAPQRSIFKHSVLHELESFWLVLLWVALKRDGPSSHGDFVAGPTTGRLVATLFDEQASYDELGRTRLSLFSGGVELFDKEITPAMSPYCHILNRLLRNLFVRLGNAYTDRSLVNGLYDDFLNDVDAFLRHAKIQAEAPERLEPFRGFLRNEWLERRSECFLPHGQFPSEALEYVEHSTNKTPVADTGRKVALRKRTASDANGLEEPAMNPRVRKKGRTTSAGTSIATIPTTTERTPSPPRIIRNTRSKTRMIAATEPPQEASSSTEASRGRQGAKRVGKAASLPGATTRSRSKAEAAATTVATRSSSRKPGKGQPKALGATKRKR
ncbi:hypothetical protein PENSPDRAFT_650916 [Peniophora sp. CONT]|nr:hypothetical protein PENSPDRAFT_650916 [Peniophora sp. CONT]